jgi:CRP-like cAMP-binding protein
MSDALRLLKQLDMFNALSEQELSKVAQLCDEATYRSGDVILNVNEPADSLYLIRRGNVEVVTRPDVAEADVLPGDAVRIALGHGQIFGEMGLVDRGARSATVWAVSDTDVYMVDYERFLALCDQSPTLGYQVMRNIAADLSFKLRHRNLI